MKKLTLICLVMLTMFGGGAQAATRIKQNNTLNLNLAGSWDTLPGIGDIAQWDSTVAGANTTILGADLTWDGIKIVNPGGLVTINAGNTVTLGAAFTDIDMTTATKDLTLNCGVSLGAANVWDVLTNRTLTVAGVLAAGANTLTKLNGGMLILNGNNSAYTGAITVSGGALSVGHGNALGDTTGNTTLSGTGVAALYVSGGISVAEPLSINGAAVVGVTARGNLRSLSGANTWSGAITGTASPRIGADAGGSLEITGGINLGNATGRTPNFVGDGNITVSSVIKNAGTGAGGVTRSLGTGTLKLSAQNTYKGNTTLYSGTTILDYTTVANVLLDTAVLSLAGGTLTLNGGSAAEVVASTSMPGGASSVTTNTGTSTLRMNVITRTVGSTVNFGAAGIADTDTVGVNDILGGYATVAGADWATNGAAADGSITAYSAYQTATSPASWAATDNVSLSGNPSASVAVNTPINSLRLTAASAVTIDSGIALTLSSGGLLVTGSGVTSIGGGGTLNGGGSADLIVHQYSSADLTLSASIANNGGATALTKSGTGTLILTGANTYTAATYVNAGTLSVSANNNLGDPGTGAAVNFAGGTLQATATFALDNAGANNRTLNLGETTTSTIDVTGGNALTVSGVLQGRGWLTKTGSGTLILTGASPTYVGETIVSGGTFLVNNPGSYAPNTVLTVGSGATLGGNGIIGGAVTVNAGGSVAAGASAGTLTLQNGLNVSAGGTNVWELASNSTATPGTDFDQIVLTAGNLDMTDSTLSIRFIGSATAPDSNVAFWQATRTWTIITVPAAANNPGPSNFKHIQNGTNAAGYFSTAAGAGGNIVLTFTPSAAPVPLVKPSITSVTGAGSTSVTVNYNNTVSGTNYTLQYNTNLNTTTWYDAGSAVAGGTTGSQTDTSPLAGEKERYYRLKFLSP